MTNALEFMTYLLLGMGIGGYLMDRLKSHPSEGVMFNRLVNHRKKRKFEADAARELNDDLNKAAGTKEGNPYHSQYK